MIDVALPGHEIDRAADSERPKKRRRVAGLAALGENPALAERMQRLREFSSRIRASEYHLTNACNIRCEGCWFFAHGIDRATREATSLADWQAFAKREAERGVTAALLIGGEPTLYPERIRAFQDQMPFVSISSNGLRALPREGFERVTVAITLFGGGELDDRLRAIQPNGKRFTGLFERALDAYHGDPRTIFIFALSAEGIEHIEPTVRRIRENGNIVNFNYYSRYGEQDALRHSDEKSVLEEALRVRALYPDTVISPPYYIRALVTGKTEWGSFGYESCPSISADHPAHAERKRNGSPTLPGFNAWSADLETLAFCCTSGHCEDCRDSQAVWSWLISNPKKFMRQEHGLETWIELSEAYWSQFAWSDYHRSAVPSAR
jgi:MoaA/NifB/PqqE/SkfB family radical SAM enzyme